MEYRLIEEIIKLSDSKNWNDAVSEWQFYQLSIVPNSTCLCEHYPIKELCHIRNLKNGNDTIVGNCCIRKFMGDDTRTKMFKAISKNRLNKSLIEYAYEKNIINKWEFELTSNLWRKRILTPRQKACFDKIQNGIISEVLKND